MLIWSGENHSHLSSGMLDKASDPLAWRNFKVEEHWQVIKEDNARAIKERKACSEFSANMRFSLKWAALCLASSSVRWCTISNEEQEKCQRLKQECFSQQQSKDFPELICVRKTDHQECIIAIK
ncbi:hypothetical protein L345_12207, partial [Ophiophagus hannah]